MGGAEQMGERTARGLHQTVTVTLLDAFIQLILMGVAES